MKEQLQWLLLPLFTLPVTAPGSHIPQIPRRNHAHLHFIDEKTQSQQGKGGTLSFLLSKRVGVSYG